MCGICGISNPAGVESEAIGRMMGTIVHRGPDDHGLYVRGPIGLGSRRLSIIDLPDGRQPISNEDGTIHIVYNGEIYNYRELRAELEGRGHRFRTRTDTEVIVHLYEELGDRCVEKLAGMFAFGLWDERRGRLLLARDRLGQKPLYYAQDGETFFFASEAKAILEVFSQARELDWMSLHHYLSLRFIPPPNTIFRSIRKLPPAHTLVLEQGKITCRRYWDLDFNAKLGMTDSAFADGVREYIVKAVRSHMVSDVPVGAFLSGGLDSSMVVAVAARDLDVQLQTFAVGVEDSDFNELPYASMVARHLGTSHVESRVASDLIGLLPRMIWHLDEPSDPIAACMFHAAELASRHVKVVLGGDGGDELFAGFDRYRGNGYINAYRLLPGFIRASVFEPFLSAVPDSFGYKSITQKLRWVHTLSNYATPAEQYAQATCFFRYSHREKSELFAPEIWKDLRQVDAAQAIVEPFNSTKAGGLLDRMLYADFMTRLPEHSLMLTDRMTMAHSLEVRSPFLDHELVEYLAAVPARLKIKGKTTKVILRQLAGDYLPGPIVEREKQGFMFPVARWFQNELYPFISSTLLNSHMIETGCFQRQAVQKMLDEHRSKRVDHHVRLWMLLNLEIWQRIFIQGEPISDLEESLALEALAPG